MSIEKQLEGMKALLEKIVAQVESLEERLRPEPTCFTYPEAAERLGVGLTKLKEMVKRGDLRKSYPLEGGVPMIALSEIQRVSVPKAERPKVERAQRKAAYKPITRKRG